MATAYKYGISEAEAATRILLNGLKPFFQSLEPFATPKANGIDLDLVSEAWDRPDEPNRTATRMLAVLEVFELVISNENGSVEFTDLGREALSHLIERPEPNN